MDRLIADLTASLGGRSVRVLTYHSISDDLGDPFAISPALFRQQMASIAASGVPVLTVSTLLAALDAQSIARTAVCLTFDDGLEDFALNALPILRDYGFPSTLFVPTALTGTTEQWPSWSSPRRFLDWAELQTLRASGVEIGSHARTHRRLSLLPPDELAGELQQSRAALAEHLDIWLNAIAYPFGDRSDLVDQLAQAAGYRAGFAVGGLWGNRVRINHYALRRLIITRDISPTRIRRIVQGFDDWSQVCRSLRVGSRHGADPGTSADPLSAVDGSAGVIARDRS